MIKIENVDITGFEAAIRGMRNPMNSWDRTDSVDDKVGLADLWLMKKLANGGPVHAKYRRMIVVYLDITAPLYWWKEFDTYKVGTVANSCSTMHKIHAKKFTLEDFSHEHLLKGIEQLWRNEYGMFYKGSAKEFFGLTLQVLNHYRDLFLQTKDEQYWWQMIQLLPSSYNQKRTVMLNYEVLAHIYPDRKNHKLDEWRDFCNWIETLPYSEIIF